MRQEWPRSLNWGLSKTNEMSDAAEDGIERTTKKKTNIKPTRGGYKCGAN